MNLTRVLGALLFVVGVGWFLAVPTVLPAAYHGHVHTGHEHAEYAAIPVDPSGQSVDTLVAASANAADAAPERNWTAARNEPLPPAQRDAFQAARDGTANATDAQTRNQYREFAARHPFVALDGRWFELDLEESENHTRLVASRVATSHVTRSVGVEPTALPGQAETQASKLVRVDGAVLVSSPAIPTPLYVEHEGDVHLVQRVGPAPAPPPLAALVLFLVPGVVLAVVGAFLGVRS